jgi:hypothetical protein
MSVGEKMKEKKNVKDKGTIREMTLRAKSTKKDKKGTCGVTRGPGGINFWKGSGFGFLDCRFTVFLGASR